jgi:hypothetical protein
MDQAVCEVVVKTWVVLARSYASQGFSSRTTFLSPARMAVNVNPWWIKMYMYASGQIDWATKDDYSLDPKQGLRLPTSAAPLWKSADSPYKFT